MKNKVFLSIMFVLCFNVISFSQEIFEVKNLIIKNELNGVLRIQKYSNKKLIKNQKCDFPQNSAEQKFCNFFNLNNKQELISFFIPFNIPESYSKEDYIDKMKIYDKKNNFYELDSKYTFDYGINKDIFIKYINHNEIFPKFVYSANYLQNFNNDLVLKGMGENFDIGMFLISSDTEKVINYFNKSANKTIDISAFCSEFLDNIKNNSTKNNLYNLLDKKYSPFFNEKLGDDIELIKNINPVVSSYNYKKVFHDIISGVRLEKNKISKKEISEKYNISLGLLVKDSLMIKEVITVNTMNNDFTIIKFYNSKTIIKTNYEVINNDLIDKNISLLTILSKLNLDFFVELCENDKSKKFPEVNKFQPIVKNMNGILSISKLMEVIEKNKKELVKFLDE